MFCTSLTNIFYFYFLRGKYIFSRWKCPNIGFWTDATASVQKNDTFMHWTFLQLRILSKGISKVFEKERIPCRNSRIQICTTFGRCKFLWNNLIKYCNREKISVNTIRKYFTKLNPLYITLVDALFLSNNRSNKALYTRFIRTKPHQKRCNHYALPQHTSRTGPTVLFFQCLRRSVRWEQDKNCHRLEASFAQ